MLFKSNGKILLCSEYLVLDGAKAIALPSKLTQDLHTRKANHTRNKAPSYFHHVRI